MDQAVLVWRKSSYSGAHTHCVEVAAAGDRGGEAFLVRDSKDAGGPVLAVGAAAWHAFLSGIKERQA